MIHVPVMAAEAVEFLRPSDGGLFVDCTVGLGGHSRALLEAGAARVIGLDRDLDALARARETLAPWGDRVELVHADYRAIEEVLDRRQIERVDGALADLGVSSLQFDEPGRGFSFQRDEPLDMRLDPDRGQTAADLLNHLDEPTLAALIHEHGEERYARRIARTIVRRRPLRTTGELVAAVRAAVPRAAWPRRTHVATRTFQALRMAVNDETGALRQTLQEIPGLLAVGGRLGVISFHSGEDRIVKQTFRALDSAGYVELEPSPLTPGDDEVRANPRARSAKLRVLERTA
jgi:16S rRNA (cytosine1402-N4)-methyltransferase